VVPDCINCEKTEKGFLVTPREKTQKGRSLWGTTQRNLSNIVKGFDKGFTFMCFALLCLAFGTARHSITLKGD